MDWIECKNRRIVKEVSKDENLVNSLIESSKHKLSSQEILPLQASTIASKISLAYDSLRELLEVLALKKGFKIYNHECYTAFLKEIIQDSSLGDSFDEIRKLRNSINYYGKQITEKECKISLEEIKNLIEKTKTLTKNHLQLDSRIQTPPSLPQTQTQHPRPRTSTRLTHPRPSRKYPFSI